jgi:hypothetical protein
LAFLRGDQVQAASWNDLLRRSTVAGLTCAVWCKSTRSGGSGNCIEVADLTCAAWRKSTRSSGSGNCVEVADSLPNVVAVRDSKDPDGPALVVEPAALAAFTEAVKSANL